MTKVRASLSSILAAPRPKLSSSSTDLQWLHRDSSHRPIAADYFRGYDMRSDSGDFFSGDAGGKADVRHARQFASMDRWHLDASPGPSAHCSGVFPFADLRAQKFHR